MKRNFISKKFVLITLPKREKKLFRSIAGHSLLRFVIAFWQRKKNGFGTQIAVCFKAKPTDVFGDAVLL